MNTLGLSIYERTRELGLLRAVGMARTQVKRNIRDESVMIALFGAVLGIVVGIGFGWALQRALDPEGVIDLAIAVGQLVVYLVFAAVAGVARRDLARAPGREDRRAQGELVRVRRAPGAAGGATILRGCRA